MVHREVRHLLRDRLALGLVGVEDALVGPALHARGQQPRQVDRVGDARVHAVAGIRHPQVRGVAGDEDAAVAEAVGHQAAADPVFLADDLVGEVRRPTPRIWRMDQSRSTESNSGSSGFRWLCTSQVSWPSMANTVPQRRGLHRVVRPARGLPGISASRPRRADVGRLHALDHRRAFQLARRSACARWSCRRRSRPGSARAGCASAPLSRSSSCTARRRRASCVKPVSCVRLSSVTPGSAAVCSQQDRLQVDLVDAVRRLRRRPPARRGRSRRCSGRARHGIGMRVSSVPRDAGAEHHVVRIVRRQARRRAPSAPRRGGGTSPCCAPPRGCTSRWAARRSGAVSASVTRTPRAAQVHRQRQAHRACADDEHVGVERSCMCVTSVELDVGRAWITLRPLRGLGADVGLERLGRGRRRLDAQVAHAPTGSPRRSAPP